MQHIDIEIENEFANFKLRVNGILIKDNKILCVQMKKNGFYCLPGGHIEIGEDSKEAVVREFKEETGIDVKVEQLISITENFFTRKNGKKIHEISFYYILKSYDEFNMEKSEYDVVEIDKDGIMEHHFKWIDICNIDNEDFRPIKIKEKIKNGNYNFEPIIIK